MKINPTLAYRFFSAVTARPKTIMALAFMIIIATATFIPTLTIDSRSEAFLPKDDPALLFRDQVEETFGLKDPMVIAIVNKAENGIFRTPDLDIYFKATA